MKKDIHQDQHFKDALNDAPVFEYDPVAWDTLQKRLDKATPKPKGVFLPHWVAAAALFLLLGLCGSTSYLAVRLDDAGQRLAVVEKQLAPKPDTIWSVKNIITRDTIYIQNWPLLAMKNAGSWARRFPLFQPGVSFSSSSIPSSVGYSGGTTPGFAPLPGQSLSSIIQEDTISSNSNLNQNWEQQLTLLPPLALSAPSPLSTPAVTLPAVVAQENQRASWIRRSAYQAVQKGKPQGVTLLGGGSIANFFSMPGTDFSSYVLNMSAELEYGPHWRLEAGLELLHFSFELQDENHFGDYPSLLPDAPSDNLQDIYVTLDYLQLPLTLKYFLNPKRTTLQPYFKAGAVLRQPRRQSFDYEFVGSGDTYYLPFYIRDDGIYLSSLRGGAGLAIPITRNWGLYTEALYHYDYQLGPNDHTLLSYFGFNAGLRLRLK